MKEKPSFKKLISLYITIRNQETQGKIHINSDSRVPHMSPQRYAGLNEANELIVKLREKLKYCFEQQNNSVKTIADIAKSRQANEQKILSIKC